MSFSLPAIDTTGFTTATVGTIDLNKVGISAGGISANPSVLNNPAHIYFFNDSGVGFQMVFKESGKGFDLPAGAWIPISVLPGNTILTYSVLYVLGTSALVNKVMMTYYRPGEPLPQAVNLGNSPIGGALLPIQTLSNEGNPAGTIVIDMGTAANSQMTEFWNDHFIVRVQDAVNNVQHLVLFGNASGNPDYLQIGQAGDEALVNGALKVAQATHLDNGTLNTDTTGALIFNNNKAARWNNNAATVRTVLYMDNSNQTNLLAGDADIIQLQDHNSVNLLKLTETSATFIGNTIIPNSLGYESLDNAAAAQLILWMDAGNNTVLQAGGGNIAFKSKAGVLWGGVDVNSIAVAGKRLSDALASQGDLADWSATGLFLKGNPSTHGPLNYQGDGSHTDAVLGSWKTGSGTTINGAVAITHGLTQLNVAATPTVVLITPTQAPTLFWITAIGGTTFTINATAAWTFNFFVMRTAI